MIHYITMESEIEFNAFIEQIDNAIHNLSDSVHETSVVPFPGGGDNGGNENHKGEDDIGLKKKSEKRNNEGVSISCSEGEWRNNRIFVDKLGAPVGLEQQFKELYRLLRRGLLGSSSDNDNYNDDASKLFDEKTSHNEKKRKRSQGSNSNKDIQSFVSTNTNNDGDKRNVSALLLGPRGQGKSLVLAKCLNLLMQESRGKQRKRIKKGKVESIVPFRVIRLNGIFLRGHDVNVTVREIVRQLSEIASRESYERMYTKSSAAASTNHHAATSETNEKHVKSDGNNFIHHKLYKLLEQDSYNLRTKRTTFQNSLAILDEALKTACIDSIPILIVMDELDAFLNVSSRSFSSSTSRSSRSSASVDVSSKRHLLLYHLLDRVAGSGSLISLVSSTSRLSTIGMFEKRVKSRVEGTTKVIYFGRPSNYEELVSILLNKIIDTSVVKENQVGDKAWFRKATSALVSLRKQMENILLPNVLVDTEHDTLNSDERQRIRDKMLIVRDIVERKFALGLGLRWFSRVVSIALSLYVEDLIENQKCCQILNTFNIEYILNGLEAMGGTDAHSKIKNSSDDVNEMNLMKGNSRMSWLLDLSGPQVAILLAAKRIFNRDNQDEVSQKPLTYERILSEYESSFIAQSKSSGPDHYPKHVIYRSFCDLLGGFFMPIHDHTGGGPLQYQYCKEFSIQNRSSLQKVALYVNVDLEEELGVALKKNRLNCTSALRDWGLAGFRT